MKRVVAILGLTMALCSGLAFVSPARAQTRDVKVLLPDDDNLQWMSFWVAKGAGYFADEAVDLALVVPKSPSEARAYFERGEANVAVLPPPVYLELIAAKFPLVLVCNLLKNDPINLVVSERAWKERGLTRGAPVADRLRAIKGLRVGVAPHPPARLRALFAAYGMDADRDIEMKIVHGKDQNDAFARGEVDALYAHTPYLEKAIVAQNAVLFLHQSGGEVPELAARQIHALVFTRAFADASPSTAAAMTRAIARAEKLLHADRAAATAALAKAFPAKDRQELDTIVELYTPAIPDTPAVSADGFAPALALFPAGRPAPSLQGIDLNAYVAPGFAADAAKPPGISTKHVALGLALVALVVIFVRSRRRTGSAIIDQGPKGEV